MKPSQNPATNKSPPLLRTAVKALRPKQWVKNVLLFAALFFSRGFTDVDNWTKAFIAFAAFCMISSTGYIFNDIRDREADRKHPKKCKRPIAAGDISVPAARILMGIIFISGCCLAVLVGQLSLTASESLVSTVPEFAIVAMLYFATTLSYSLFFKNFVILDVMFIAAGFVWRAAAGAVAIDAEISPWLLVCTVFLSLFLGFNKRRGELELMQGAADTTRKSLSEYNSELLRQIQGITTSSTILSYALYAVLGPPYPSPETDPLLLLTLPLV